MLNGRDSEVAKVLLVKWVHVAYLVQRVILVIPAWMELT